MIPYINLLKTIACLLILNFHCEPLFPTNMSFLSFGGDIGNNLFFMVSGFLLYEQIKKYKISDFIKYYLPKIKKIIFPLFIFEIISTLSGYINIHSFLDFFLLYIFPTNAWFLTAILALYVIFFFQTKLLDIKKNIIVICTLSIITIVFYNIFIERYVVGYISMLIGYILKEYAISKKLRNVPSICPIMFLFMYFASKYIKHSYSISYNVIGFLISLSIVMLSSSLLIISYSNRDFINDLLKKNILVDKFTKLISRLTLDIYLVQVYGDYLIINTSSKYLVFPLSYIVAMIIIISIAYLIYHLRKAIIKT